MGTRETRRLRIPFLDERHSWIYLHCYARMDTKDCVVGHLVEAAVPLTATASTRLIFLHSSFHCLPQLASTIVMSGRPRLPSIRHLLSEDFAPLASSSRPYRPSPDADTGYPAYPHSRSANDDNEYDSDEQGTDGGDDQGDVGGPSTQLPGVQSVGPIYHHTRPRRDRGTRKPYDRPAETHNASHIPRASLSATEDEGHEHSLVESSHPLRSMPHAAAVYGPSPYSFSPYGAAQVNEPHTSVLAARPNEDDNGAGFLASQESPDQTTSPGVGPVRRSPRKQTLHERKPYDHNECARPSSHSVGRLVPVSGHEDAFGASITDSPRLGATHQTPRAASSSCTRNPSPFSSALSRLSPSPSLSSPSMAPSNLLESDLPRTVIAGVRSPASALTSTSVKLSNFHPAAGTTPAVGQTLPTGTVFDNSTPEDMEKTILATRNRQTAQKKTVTKGRAKKASGGSEDRPARLTPEQRKEAARKAKVMKSQDYRRRVRTAVAGMRKRFPEAFHGFKARTSQPDLLERGMEWLYDEISRLRQKNTESQQRIEALEASGKVPLESL
ncbi:hypothetical protein FA95DRAFT_1556886 [Auriscalpium vulgare]|uniref:Uncharacterized protein n=1 Tax=Auriscalpium vulgare TaxID=40419 RepID=A0ACB8RZZ1_9AGAM|nr:hypothetical protein FA95DRAFT_1556886 [Auriscalpium vulgare]